MWLIACATVCETDFSKISKPRDSNSRLNVGRQSCDTNIGYKNTQNLNMLENRMWR